MPRVSPNFKRALIWRRDGAGWVLLHNRRRMGRVAPDSDHPGMWRSLKPRGEVSDIANLTWAKNAVLVAAEIELQFDDRRQRATAPSKCPENEGVFQAPASPVSFFAADDAELGAR
jgi:hypothetical protein